MNVEKIRQDFPILRKKINGKPIIYLDNAATSLKPIQAIDAMNQYYNETTANVNRGVHKLSQTASEIHENCHKKVAEFINAKTEEIVFTRNATESINSIMYSLLQSDFFKKGDEILVSKMEHHCNIVPWQFLEKKLGIKLNFAELNEDFTLDLDDLQNRISNKTKIVSITQASNTVASINDVEKIGKIVHDNKSLFIVDGAQSVPHFSVNVKKLNCDFLAFSGHKMLGPTGIGVLYGKKELLEKMPPFLYGGDMIQSVKWHDSLWNKLPYKFEAGTPHIAGSFGLSAAIDYLQKIGLENIHSYEKQLTKIALEKMSEIDGVKLYCPQNVEKQVGIVLFEIEKMHCHDTALALDELENIAIRSGMHCAEPLVSSINSEGLARASFYFYNTIEEIEKFTETLKQVAKQFR